MNILITDNNVNAIFKKLNYTLLKTPEYRTNVRGYYTHELINARIILTNPYRRIVTLVERNISMSYLIGELSLYLKGSDKLEEYAYYSKFWNKVSDDGAHINSAYGKRLFYAYDILAIGSRFETANAIVSHYSQFNYIVEILKQDEHSRKAVMTIYDKRDAFESKDNPCTLNLQFLIRDNKLYCITNMRSNDLYFGFTYDIPFFTFVQEMLYIKLLTFYPTLKMGTYVHNVGSLHMYARDFKKSELLNDELPTAYLDIEDEMPRLNNSDMESWFIELLHVEKQLREWPKKPFTEIVTATPFQKYAINILKEKRDGIISSTNIIK